MNCIHMGSRRACHICNARSSSSASSPVPQTPDDRVCSHCGNRLRHHPGGEPCRPWGHSLPAEYAGLVKSPAALSEPAPRSNNSPDALTGSDVIKIAPAPAPERPTPCFHNPQCQTDAEHEVVSRNDSPTCGYRALACIRPAGHSGNHWFDSGNAPSELPPAPSSAPTPGPETDTAPIAGRWLWALEHSASLWNNLQGREHLRELAKALPELVEARATVADLKESLRESLRVGYGLRSRAESAEKLAWERLHASATAANIEGHLREKLRAAERQRDEATRIYALLAASINEDNSVCPEGCNSYGHVEGCQQGMAATIIEGQQRELETLRGRLAQLSQLAESQPVLPPASSETPP